MFDLIVRRARDLCGGYGATVYQFDGTLIHWRAATGVSDDPTARQGVEAMYPMGPTREWPSGRAIIDRQIIHIRDLETEPGLTPALRGLTVKSAVLVPLMRSDLPIGALSLGNCERGGFTDTQIELLKTFAEQAVIAITSAETYRELQQRTGDLQEALQQQTATADVLKVISSSHGKLEPVFQALLGNAVHLCEAEFAILFLPEGNEFRAVGQWNLPPAYSEFLRKNTISADPRIPLSRASMTKQPVQVADILVDQSYIERHPGMVAVAEDGGARTLLQVPMLKENELVGTIGIYRQQVRPFSDKQITLVQNFAAQAVIAIENASLLNELRQRTDDLTRSLNDLRTAQDRLVQTEKLASLGQLTAGIAHEIKNPLNFVNNFSALSSELVGEMNDVLAKATLDERTRGELNELAQMLNFLGLYRDHQQNTSTSRPWPPIHHLSSAPSKPSPQTILGRAPSKAMSQRALRPVV
ncbi:MAG: GAF domain-containing protein [Bradyrhizobium sp.]